MKSSKSSKYDSEHVANLAEQVLSHKNAYYSGKPIISDFDYDKIEDELRSLAPKHPVLEIVGSLSSDSSNKKVLHDSPMLSLAKTYSEEDLLSWVGTHSVVGSLKIDGSSMSLVYKDGEFLIAKTRGNGREGEDVTVKIKWVPDVIPRISNSLNLEIRGELYCTESQFIHLANEMERLGLERPTSPRNIVAGVLGRKSYTELARYFNFFAFEVIGGLHFKSEIEKSEWLATEGFRLPKVKLLKSKEEVLSYLGFVREEIEEGEVGCDGAVFSYNDLRLHEELGVTSHHPRYKNSFKWQGETAQSKIVRIDWATSRFGVITPVAVVNPVTLSGAKITNITLHNAGYVQAFHLKIGDEIEIVRSGEVIPKFLSVVKSADGPFEMPDRCPSCDSKVFLDDIRLRCSNTISCPAQRLGVILNWIKAVEIDDLSEKRLQAMIEADLVQSIPDLYRLKVADFLKLPSTKEKMAAKLFENINATRSLPLPVFLNGLGIEGTGQTSWEKIADHFSSLEQILNLTPEDVIAIDGFAEKSAQQLCSGLKVRVQLIEELQAVGVVPQERAKSSQKQSLAEMQFVITGALSRSRKEVEDLIKGAGGRIASSVSKNTSVLITNEGDSNSSKMEKARLLGVTIWSENDLINRI